MRELEDENAALRQQLSLPPASCSGRGGVVADMSAVTVGAPALGGVDAAPTPGGHGGFPPNRQLAVSADGWRNVVQKWAVKKLDLDEAIEALAVLEAQGLPVRYVYIVPVCLCWGGGVVRKEGRATERGRV